MATANNAKQHRYTTKYVHGSVAYDEAQREYVYDSRPLDIPAGKEIKEAVVAGTAVLQKQSVSPVIICAFALAAVLLTACIMGKIYFTQAAAETAELQQQLEELTEEQEKLEIQYESSIDLNEIEEYAETELGMQKPRSDQIRYVNGSAQDKAKIIESSK